MGLIDFAKHVYGYFTSDGTESHTMETGIATTLDSYVPVYNTSGQLVRYIERPPGHETALNNSQSNSLAVLSSRIPSVPLYRRLPDGQYIQVSASDSASPSMVPSLVVPTPNPTVPSPQPSLPPITSHIIPHPTVSSQVKGIVSQWDAWPDGNLAYDLTFKEYEDTGNLLVHWAITTSGGDRKGSEHANHWEAGKRSRRQCLGVMECENPACQFITRPHIKSFRIDAQLKKPCEGEGCGANLVLRTCDVVSYIWIWSGGVHYENRGTHLHRRPTQLLHLLPKERAEFEALVNSHPKSGPLQLVIGVPGLRGPGKSAAEISNVLLNAHRVGKERLKIIKGETIGTIDKLIGSFAKFDADNPNVVLHSTFGAETVISLQTPFMRSQLVQDGRFQEPINGIVSDATHNWWIGPNSLLIISSTYCPVLRCWVPGLFSYSNGASTNHFQHHFYALVRSIALEAQARNIPVTKELFAGMMDFSEAERGGFIEGYLTYFLQRPDNTLSRQELHVIAERILKGCREHFRVSCERVSKMHNVVPRDCKEDFIRRTNGLIFLKSAEEFIEQANLLVKDYPNIRNWMEWWTRPAHARMLFESQREMDIELWNSLPDTNNAEEAMNWKLYQGCGRDHHFLEGMYALLKVAHHYEAQFKAASTGVPIRYGQPEPWKSIAEKHGHTKPSRARALDSQDAKRKKNDGRPPDTSKELTTRNNTEESTQSKLPTLKSISKGPLLPSVPRVKSIRKAPPPPSVLPAIRLGVPSYKWHANSCWLDTSLELLFICVMRRFVEFRSLFDGISENTILFEFLKVFNSREALTNDSTDDTITREMARQRDTFREALHKFGTVKDTVSSHQLLGWVTNIIRRSLPMSAYPLTLYFNTWYIDLHRCTGSPEWGHHIEIVQPRNSFEIQLTEERYIQYKGDFKAYFRDRMRIDRKPTPATMCWRVKDATPLCPGTREDIKDIVLTIPVIFAVEIAVERGAEPHPWNFPDALYPHTQVSAKDGLVYDLVGLALFNPLSEHFIARFASVDRKTIYTYDGMAHNGFPKEEPKAKFRGYISGPNINLPKGYRVYQAMYFLRGGLGAQEKFFNVRAAALTRKFHFKFGSCFKDSMPSVVYPTPFRDLHHLPPEDRVQWTKSEKTVEYVSKLPSKLEEPRSDKSVQALKSDELHASVLENPDELQAPLNSESKSNNLTPKSALQTTDNTTKAPHLDDEFTPKLELQSTDNTTEAPHPDEDNAGDQNEVVNLCLENDSDVSLGPESESETIPLKKDTVARPLTPKPSPPSSIPDSLFQLNCRCGIQGDGNRIHDPAYGMAIQCIECRDWSHVACQRNGRASKLTDRKKDQFVCDFCSLQGILPLRSDIPKREKRHTRHQKPLHKRLIAGLGALAKHGDFWYPVRLMHYNQASKTWNVLWWRECTFPLSDIVPGSITQVKERHIVDSLWMDRTARRQIRLGKWVHAIEVVTDEDILSNPLHNPYTEEIDTLLSPSIQILRKLMLNPRSMQVPGKIDDIPALKWLKANRKPLSSIVPFAGDLTIRERSQISNWFELKVADGLEQRRSKWLGLLPLAHAFTLYILAKLDDKALEKFDRELEEKAKQDKELADLMKQETENSPGQPADDEMLSKRIWTPLEKAWYMQTNGRRTLWETIDVDRECISQLENDMFERSQVAGIAGNWQWGLDAGDHQDKWNPYEGMYSEWFVSNRDSESESERQRGHKYIEIPSVVAKSGSDNVTKPTSQALDSKDSTGKQQKRNET